MKRIISLMLVVVLCASLFTGCGTSAATPSATPQASATATAKPIATEKKTLTLFHHMGEEAKKAALQGSIDSLSQTTPALRLMFNSLISATTRIP
jgi:ABC-type glycerol-3-phosphate transport system substrate-binding protein